MCAAYLVYKGFKAVKQDDRKAVDLVIGSLFMISTSNAQFSLGCSY